MFLRCETVDVIVAINYPAILIPIQLEWWVF